VCAAQEKMCIFGVVNFKILHIMEKNSYDSIKNLEHLTNLLAEKRASWSQQLLLISSSLLGILVSLHAKSSDSLYVRLCFALAIVLLAIGILLTAVSLYSYVEAISRTRQAYKLEAIDALHHNRETKPVSAPVKKIFVFCEKTGYICFASCVFFLSLYVVLNSFL
jgi:hypothetical protein